MGDINVQARKSSEYFLKTCPRPKQGMDSIIRKFQISTNFSNRISANIENREYKKKNTKRISKKKKNKTLSDQRPKSEFTTLSEKNAILEYRDRISGRKVVHVGTEEKNGNKKQARHNSKTDRFIAWSGI